MTTDWQPEDGPDNGAAIVEMAIVFPLLVLMIIGIIEIGVAFRDYLTVSAASREGARVAALAGAYPRCDGFFAR